MAGECHVIHLYVEKVKIVLTNLFQSVRVIVRIERESVFFQQEHIAQLLEGQFMEFIHSDSLHNAQGVKRQTSCSGGRASSEQIRLTLKRNIF